MQIHSGAPLVSVITPVFNAQSTLDRTVRSVRGQSMADWEMLVIDDGSQDQSQEIAREHQLLDCRIRPLTLPINQGPAAARNMGLEAARGRYIAFLDADDTWEPEKLCRQLDFMSHERVPFSYTAFWRASTSRVHHVRVPPRVSYEKLLGGNVIGCLTAVYDRAFFGDVLMPILLKRQDFAFWLKLLDRCDYAGGLQEPLATYYRQISSVSSHKVGAICASWHCYRQHLGLSRLHSARYLSSHLVRRILRG